MNKEHAILVTVRVTPLNAVKELRPPPSTTSPPPRPGQENRGPRQVMCGRPASELVVAHQQHPIPSIPPRDLPFRPSMMPALWPAYRAARFSSAIRPPIMPLIHHSTTQPQPNPIQSPTGIAARIKISRPRPGRPAPAIPFPSSFPPPPATRALFQDQQAPAALVVVEVGRGALQSAAAAGSYCWRGGVY